MFIDKQNIVFLLRDSKGRDMFLCLIILLLAFGGLVALQPISSIIAQKAHQDPAYFIKKQGLWLAIGLVGMLFFASVRLSKLRPLVYLMMLFSLTLLSLVFVPGIGKSVTSSYGTFNRWLDLGPISLQPSEFSKIALILFLAEILSRPATTQNRIYPLLKPALMIGALLLAIIIEPQYGTTICIIGVIILLVYLAGFPLIRLIGLGISLLPLLGILILFWRYRLERLYVWLDPYSYRFEGGYQLVTSFRAFRNGGWAGNDLASGIAHRYLTYGHSDFAFALLAENFGWLGTCLLLIGFCLLLWRSLFLLQKVDDQFCFLAGSGALIMLISQSLLNLFVVTGLVPTTGVGLPFLSYGGSSLVTSLCLCGILLNATKSPSPR